MNGIRPFHIGLWLAVMMMAGPLSAQEEPVTAADVELTEVTGLVAADFPGDDGSDAYVTWDKMPFDAVKGVEYVVKRTDADGKFEEVQRFAADKSFMSDVELPFWCWDKNADRHFAKIPTPVRKVKTGKKNEDGTDETKDVMLRGEPVGIRVYAVLGDRTVEVSGPITVTPHGNLFAPQKLNTLVVMLVFSGVLFAFLEFAKRRELFLRKIPGLAAVDEALGRATEMGKPVFYMTGRHDVDKPSTIAACIILGEVAKKTAAYDVALQVPHTYSITMEICREITREAYIEAGRPDAYSDDMNYYITEEQFSYAAAVNGKMLREKPGAVIYMGYYYAESLMMAEAGAEAGAIQIAGTDAESQLPFFVTVCDYTLIGEELYAASAYFSRKPALVGALRGQDLGKLAIMVTILVGTMVVTALQLAGWKSALGRVRDLLGVFG